MLRHCVPALRRPRPLPEAERLPWEATIKKAETAFDAVKPAMAALKRAGKMEFYLLLDIDIKRAEDIYADGVARKLPTIMAVFGALLGKPLKPETAKEETLRSSTRASAIPETQPSSGWLVMRTYIG